jgi:hypothetical protein
MLNNSITQQIEQVLKEYPLLLYNNQKRMFFGTIIIDQKDEDSYTVEIYIHNFSESFPIVKEVGERIPRNADRHIYSTGNCCFTTEAKEQLLLKKHVFTLSVFIRSIVIPFFQNNSYYEINKRYRYGAYSHGPQGNIEAYKEILNIDDINKVIFILLSRVVNRYFSDDNICFCSNDKKLKFCHINNYNDLLLIDPTIIKEDLNNFFRLHNINDLLKK